MRGGGGVGGFGDIGVRNQELDSCGVEEGYICSTWA